MAFHKKVIYQLYPKSFYDSDGDGVGDLRGIIEKIDYLKALHIDMIWFNPFFVSPQYDNGYDVADYRQIDPRFGTMADFEELAQKLKAAGIDIMLDMVLNHTSTQHVWFQKALAGDKHYQDYYYIRPPKPDGSLPTNWESKFGGPAWAPFGDTGNYYLHLYERRQADLDWHNPAVRQEAAAIINFWRAKGVHGFRFDVLNVIGKANQLVDAPPEVESKTLYTDTPIVQDYIKELAANSFGQDPNSVTVGEMSSTTIKNSIAYTKPENHELSMVFQFHHLKTDYKNGEKWSKMPYDFKALRNILHTWGQQLDQGGGWQALFWNNHDQPRALNRFGDVGQYRVKSAEMLAAAIHLSRGTPYIYMGEEIGMTDPHYHSMADYVDVEAKNAYQALLKAGKSEKEAFAIILAKARDNSRTPMQWDDTANAGFTTGTPWLRSTNQREINVKAELAHGEIFRFYQKLIALRKQYQVISDGSYVPFGTEIDRLYAYERVAGDAHLLVLNNFSDKTITVPLPPRFQHARVLITNEADLTPTATMTLPPYATIALLQSDKGE
ncbi:alpha,alpha-phosphotrehalase [Lacticaseibacillus rhamnosus]|uniref:alpha,alpha-phosphotrehalase n=1 Tax=Lacticaseibacillus rhamnosus TaxID=47715 RepID=UPI0008A38C24|nr:alpha,alpha-phosphotrehalase [Lacticaseibacillus rhamnosus]MDK7184127.1 alpha,alpha-phosphotrehalase [Lacticaseibacillus rhamnosus]MDK7240376.1 alpha,alpha-phosphotrehalase [Lacticaseibacillus rhamnosus]MDT8863421.1 alpha,alpha-phosphotrehalase [Lacticaseibacillus rhamnosus]OFN11924.1 alpha,alpha-phosphotrehalase [Lactobacillus sp. HMSC072E07]